MDMKRDYYEDIRLFPGVTKAVWFCLMIIALGALPFIIPSHLLGDVNYMAICVIVAVGLNILVGFTGQVSLGHAGFFAIGAYSAALILKGAAWCPFPAALLIAGIIAAAFGFILGLPSLKLEGPYLAIATLGFGMAITQVLGRFSVFGGRSGLPVPGLDLFAGAVAGTGLFTPGTAKDVELYAVIIPITVILTLLARNIIRTRVGRAFIAIRDDDIAAQAMGVNMVFYKTLAFAVSAFYTGVAGGLYALWLGFISPESFDFILSVIFLAMVVVGGVGSVSGAVLGAIVVAFLNLNLKPDSLAAIPLVGDFLAWVTGAVMDPNGIASVSFIIFGAILIAVVVFEPLGLFGFWIRTKKYWKTWPF